MKKFTFLVLLCLLGIVQPSLADSLVPINLKNNSFMPDNSVYVAVIGRYNNQWVYYDLTTNSATNNGIKTLNTSVNTLHKVSTDWGYANIFTPLSDIKNKTFYTDHSLSCRIYISFGSPMYIHAFDDGFAGPDMANSADPNHDIRYESMEYSYDQYDVLFINTTRVDAFQYPMGVELFGNEKSSLQYMKRGETANYKTIIDRWKAMYGTSAFADCYSTPIKKDNIGGIITQPSKVASIKDNGYFDDYINRIWSKYANEKLYVDLGKILGKWTGQVNGNTFVLTSDSDPSKVASVGKPTTTDVIEGAGTFATGSEVDKQIQAQFCGAMNRGVIDLSTPTGVYQDWGDTSKFFKTDIFNPYVQFFHQKDLVYEGYSYAFCYDDTYDQSSTCAIKYPVHVDITIGGFCTDQDPKENTGGNEEKPDQGGDGGNNSGTSTGTGTGDQGGLKYQYTFTENGSNVTVNFKVLDNGTAVGVVAGQIQDLNDYSYTDGDSRTWTNCKNGDVIKCKMFWASNLGRIYTSEISYTVGTSTGIKLLNAGKDTTAPVYTINGQMVKKDAATTNGLKPGVYIYKGKKIFVRK